MQSVCVLMWVCCACAHRGWQEQRHGVVECACCPPQYTHVVDVRNQSSSVSLPCDRTTEEPHPDTGLACSQQHPQIRIQIHNTLHYTRATGALHYPPVAKFQILTHTESVCAQILIAPKDSQSHPHLKVTHTHPRSHSGSELHTDVQVAMSHTNATSKTGLSTHSHTHKWLK